MHVLPGGMKLTLLSPRPADVDEARSPCGHGSSRNTDLSRGLASTTGSSSKGRRRLRRTSTSWPNEPFSSDPGAPNGTSIALLAEYDGASALLTADAHAPVLVESIRRLLGHDADTPDKLKLDVFKVAHHGSQHNLSSELLELLDCQRYLLSSNGDHFCHPDRQAIARIIKYGGKSPALYFNYRTPVQRGLGS